MKVRLQYFGGCPHWQTLDDRLKALGADIAFDLIHEIVDTPEKVDETGFIGSPTVLIDGRDPLAEPGQI